MKWMITQKHDSMNVRDYLQQVRGLSKRILIAAKSEAGQILVNGEQVTVRRQLQTGDELEVKLPIEPISKRLIPQQIELTIVYEDEAILIINKPAGIATLPSAKHQSGTIANGILGYYEQLGNPNTVHIVTRLDRDTSGLILIAKERLSHSLLAKSQKQHGIYRKYQAIVEGRLQQPNGKINAPIARKSGSIIEREVNAAGKKAITHYQIVEQWKNYSLLNIELETGRTHQIRVHFSHMNHPLAGDDLYGGKKEVIARQALHCGELVFTHPYTNELHTFTAELPEDFKLTINKINQEV